MGLRTTTTTTTLIPEAGETGHDDDGAYLCYRDGLVIYAAAEAANHVRWKRDDTGSEAVGWGSPAPDPFTVATDDGWEVVPVVWMPMDTPLGQATVTHVVRRV